MHISILSCILRTSCLAVLGFASLTVEALAFQNAQDLPICDYHYVYKGEKNVLSPSH